MRLILAHALRLNSTCFVVPALEKAASAGYYEAVCLLLQYWDESGAYKMYAGRALEMAAQGGHNNVTLLLPHCYKTDVAGALAAAVKSRQKNTAELLVRSCDTSELGRALEAAENSDQVDLLEMLLAKCPTERDQSHFSRERIHRAFISAAGRDKSKILKLLGTKCKGFIIEEALVRAVTTEKIEAVQSLLQICKTEKNTYAIRAGLMKAGYIQATFRPGCHIRYRRGMDNLWSGIFYRNGEGTGNIFRPVLPDKGYCRLHIA